MDGSSYQPRQESTSTTEPSPGITEHAAQPRPVSVTIPVHNGSRTLARCLDAVYASLGIAPDVVVVDDGSTDGSVEIARSYPCRILSLGRNLGAAAARNAGAAMARTDIIVFVDADMYVLPDALWEMVSVLDRDPLVDVVGGCSTEEAADPDWGPTLLAMYYYHSLGWRDNAERLCTSGFQSDLGAIRRSVFEEVSGFDEGYAGAGVEEYDFGHRLSDRHPRWMIRSARAVHDYRGIGARVRTVFRRTRIYARLFRRKRSLETGQTPNTRNALIAVSVQGLSLAAILAPFNIAASVAVALGSIAAYAGLLAGFLRYAAGKSFLFAVYSFFALLPVFWVVGPGFAVGLLGSIRRGQPGGR